VFLDDTRFERRKVVIGTVFSTTIDGHAVLPKRSARFERVDLRGGEWAINPPGVWHTVDVDGTAAALFVTVGWGIQHRPR
jgi:hypothetical protein